MLAKIEEVVPEPIDLATLISSIHHQRGRYQIDGILNDSSLCYYNLCTHSQHSTLIASSISKLLLLGTIIQARSIIGSPQELSVLLASINDDPTKKSSSRTSHSWQPSYILLRIASEGTFDRLQLFNLFSETWTINALIYRRVKQWDFKPLTRGEKNATKWTLCQPARISDSA